MIRALIALALVGGLLSGVFWLAVDYSNAKRDVSDLTARQEQASEVTRILGVAMARERARALTYRDDYEELANVQDDETCRSPALDRAFIILQQRRGDPRN